MLHSTSKTLAFCIFNNKWQNFFRRISPNARLEQFMTHFCEFISSPVALPINMSQVTTPQL
ncbi:hypothetical protein Sjap_025459 [Stephania japonica]|uniref:Uncharacterized protein n=1 Tax=Stephania japonica TaxID=461633 RepID=A0AAP0HE81_9MAGN